METINRSAIVVMPGQPFLDWLHRVDPTSAELSLEDLRREPTIYLLPESENEEAVGECLKEVCAEIFEEQLNGWYQWEPYVAPVATRPASSKPPKPPRIQKREAKRQQTLAQRKAQAAAAGPFHRSVGHVSAFSAALLGAGRGLLQAHRLLRKRQELNRCTRQRILQLLSPTLQVVAVHYRQPCCLLTLPEFARILRALCDRARSKLREKIRRIEKNLYSILENARPP